MPPKITYWTGIWDPAREALSREVEALRSVLGPGAPIISFSTGQRSAWRPRNRVIRLSAHRWMALRSLGCVVEPFGDVTHVFGEMNAWHLLRAVGRRPILFTVAIQGPPLPRALYDKVGIFVAETEVLAENLQDAGVSQSRIRLIRPGVDLSVYSPPPRRSGSFRVVFASSPATPDHFERRGIPLLVDTARLCPDVEFMLLWRNWGNRSKTDAAFEALRPPRNVVVVREDIPNIADVYRAAHATLWMGAEGYGKSCPNSVVEGLACGCPAIVSDSCGIARLVAQSGAGFAPSRQPHALATSIEQLRGRYAEASEAARSIAEQHFSMERFLGRYQAVYAEVSALADLDTRPLYQVKESDPRTTPAACVE